MNSKQLSIVLGVVVVILLAVVGYMAMRDNSQTDTLSQQNTAPNSNLANTNVNTTQPLNNTNTQTPANTTPTSTDETAKWKTYTNDTYAYSIKYPNSVSGIGANWVYEENGIGTYFGPPSSKSGGYVWSVLSYDKNTKSKEDLIKDMGSQFSDRKESRQNITVNGTSTVLVTVTTSQVDNWVSKAVYIEKNNRIYVIGNGAIDKPEYVSFYNTFKFTK